MKIKIKKFGKLLQITSKEWIHKDPFRESAIIAYYAIFSIPGLLLFIITLTGLVFGKEEVNQSILSQVSSTMGADTAAQLGEVLVIASQTSSTVLGSIIGIFILMVGATGVFVELQKTFNRIWRVEAVPKNGLWLILKARLFSFGLILAIAFLLLISLVVSTALTAMSDWIKVDTSEVMVVVFDVLNFILSLIIISILFAMMFKILPDAKIKWNHVWLGAIVAGVLFTIGKTVLAYYFGKAEPGSVYGAAGSVILILLWVSYSSMILFFGAEFTAAYAYMYSGKVLPSDIAVADDSDERES